ncbi:RraA family protein [Parasphingopyxis algicola]|uniref:RraA family protein n=1 Tax=Parasphingopyxis algicola TaxID=2026624 RepID=UPI0015A2899D|nr:RraA family protein [Parasphingopyxis algicola]QLC24854.1 RraA family protein [Parasphingopyxis algicola]
MVRGDVPAPIPRSLIKRLEAIGDLSSTVSDVLDELGLVGAVGASALRPTLPGGRVIGRAITVRNQEQRVSPLANATGCDWKMAEIVAIAEAERGDVLLIGGVAHVSNMGGLIATIAKRQGLAGAVVDGAVRDVAHSRGIEFPIWSSHVSPITGKWRCITREINGPVTLVGVTVSAGDLVIADETGVCFVPAERVAEVVERCEQISEYETKLENDIESGLTVEDLIDQLYGANAEVADNS